MYDPAGWSYAMVSWQQPVGWLMRRVGLATSADAVVEDVLDEYRMDTYQGHNPFRIHHHETLLGYVEELGVDRDASVLDVGTGPGHLVKRLGDHGFTNLHACDVNPPSVEPDGVFEFDQLDFVEDGLAPYDDGQFDLVVCSEVLEHLRDPYALLPEVARVLAPSGDALFTFPNVQSLPSRWHYLRHGSFPQYRVLDRAEVESKRNHVTVLTDDVFRSVLHYADLEVAAEFGGYGAFVSDQDADARCSFLLDGRRVGHHLSYSTGYRVGH
jgi:SAM-dependent methyltransferase